VLRVRDLNTLAAGLSMKGTAMSRAKYNLSVERHRMLNDLQHIQENRTIVSMLNELPDEWHTVGIDVVTRPPKPIPHNPPPRVRLVGSDRAWCF
jgi:hypothetical protein